MNALRTIIAVPALMLLTGCLAVHKVHYSDATRTDARFESLKASNTFYEALLARKFPSDGKPSRILFGQTLYSSETRPSANVVFNSAAAAADLNHDAFITEREANTFATDRRQVAP